jgi:error-prone DNA polymerase
MWRAHAPRLEGLFAREDLERDAPSPHLPALGKMEQLLFDYGRLGLSIDDHPMCHLRETLRARRVARAADLKNMRDRAQVTIAGLVIGRQRPGTASGVTFITLEDETGVANLVVTVPVFDQFRHPLLYSKLIVVSGQLEKEGEVIHVLVRNVERLEMRQGAGTYEKPVELPARSRDFH